MGTPTVITVPAGSEAGSFLVVTAPETVASTSLNSLANGSSVSSLTYSNPTSASHVIIYVVLASLTPTSGGKIKIDNGTDAYELEVSTTTAPKHIKFNNIPAAFISSFTVTNNTGVALASSGNIVAVGPYT